jgi:hypothetical protein
MTMAKREEDTTAAQEARDEDMTKTEARGKTTNRYHHRRNAEDAHTRNRNHLHPVALVALYPHNKISSAKETMLPPRNLSWKNRNPTSTRQAC